MEDYIYRKARRRVKQKKGFYAHLSAFIAVGVFFLTMNLVTDPWDLWFFYPMMPWGMGLMIHYFGVFGLPGKERVLTQKWEEREMEREVRRLERLQKPKEEDGFDTLDLPSFDQPREKVREKNRWSEEDLV
jgi:hypothetical protein